MKRRTFIQSLSTIFLPFVGKPAQQAAPAPDGPVYTDSDGRTSEQLASLHDTNRASGGVTYQP